MHNFFENEQNKKVLRNRVVQIWITAIFLTISIVWLQAYFGRMILHWIGVEISLGAAIIGAIVANFIMGVIKAFRYGQNKTKKESQ